MGRISGLVPSRFLTLLAHLVVVITLFWSRDSNIQACLPLKFTPEEYEKQDMQLVAALSVTLALFAVELAGFFSGVSMFNSTQSLILHLWPYLSSYLSVGSAPRTGTFLSSAVPSQPSPK
ncbi:transmembrane protein 107 isoform X2 [Neophocaena asiaeorientalis asiaeorientalis]|uniref:Transmembrane protein 107 n=1 Tax=Neophocaena asiaeorientalis asiaeorientalis TaxID=1706337 RepID=A0A341BN04_NEOAA|nr:transmembrane protein 107 isoform X2 [Neophocaena asiaeorientalis asiaeorientalis]